MRVLPPVRDSFRGPGEGKAALKMRRQKGNTTPGLCVPFVIRLRGRIQRPGHFGRWVILDDALARRFAVRLRLRLTGTLGLLLKAKKTGQIESVRPYLDRLEALRFRIDAATRRSVLTLADESPG